MVKKYHKYDIAVVYRTCDYEQLKRITKYCKAYRFDGQDIRCKVAIINYDTSIIEHIKEGKIYMTIHADYSHSAYKVYPNLDDRIDGYIGITKHICSSFEKKFGKKCMLSYNPLTLDKKKRLVLVSATRLSKVKGKDRMIMLANALDEAGIDYIWYVFTNDKDEIKSKNVMYMKPRLDVYKWIREADYVVQLSDTEGLSYTINEALYSNVPVIVTPLPYLEEIGVRDSENAYIMNFDCSNVREIVSKIMNVPKFKFKQLEDSYDTILAKGKSKYVQEEVKNVRVQCIVRYWDVVLERYVFPPEIFIVDTLRGEYLESMGLVRICE